MKVLVCGGRDYNDEKTLFTTLNLIHKNHPIKWIIHGAAAGADTLAGKWAQATTAHCWTFPADWNRYGKGAGAIRNRKMLADSAPDLVVAFPGGPGTAHMTRISQLVMGDIVIVGLNGGYVGPAWAFRPPTEVPPARV